MGQELEELCNKLQQFNHPILVIVMAHIKSEDHFSELMNEINYAKALLGSKTWILAQYYNHMADFHDYINDPAPNLRILADKWLQEHSG